GSFPRAPSANVPPRNSAVCLQLHGLFFMWWTPFKWLKNVALKCVNCVPLQHLFPPFSISAGIALLALYLAAPTSRLRSGYCSRGVIDGAGVNTRSQSTHSERGFFGCAKMDLAMLARLSC